MEDPKKQRAKSRLISSIRGRMQEVEPLGGEVTRLISALNNAVGGIPSGEDARLVGDCQRALERVNAARSQLSSALSGAMALDTTTLVWVDDYY